MLKLRKVLQCPTRNKSKVNIHSPCEVFQIEGPFIEANLAVAVFLFFVFSHTSTVMLQLPSLSLGNCRKVCILFFREISLWIERTVSILLKCCSWYLILHLWLFLLVLGVEWYTVWIFLTYILPLLLSSPQDVIFFCRSA